MKPFLKEILDWSEVWSPLMILAAYLYWRPKQRWTRIMFYYSVFALINNGLSTFFWKQMRLGVYEWMKDTFPFLYNSDGTYGNIIFYNLGSLIRFLLLAWCFSILVPYIKKLNRIVAALYFLLFIYLFFIAGDIRDFSSAFMATEVALLLLYCFIYFFEFLKDEESSIKTQPSFGMVTGLSIYVVINFPIFLFFNALSVQSYNFAVNVWDVHNLFYIIFCLFTVKSFHAARN